MRKNTTLNLRVSAEFKRKLSEEAAKANRSVTNYIETIIREYWTRRRYPRVKNAEKDSASDKM
jgi:hypothetical protein